MRDVHGKRERGGFVLLTVTLVGALLFISALMFVSQLTTESHVTKTDAYFKTALNVAETGLTDVLMDIKNGVGSPEWAQTFASGSATFAAVESSAVHGTYRVSVDVVDVQALAGDQYTGEIQITSEARVYAPAVTPMVIGGVSNSAYVARRAVRTNSVATWTVSPTTIPGGVVREYGPFPVDYGVFTGSDLVIKGSSQEITGNVWANGDIEIAKLSGLIGGDAYSGSGSITGALPPSRVHTDQGDKAFPEINIDGAIDPANPPDTWGYRALFDAYVMGTFPFNDAGALMYPTRFIDTNLITGGLNRALYSVGTLYAAAVPSDVADPRDPSRKLLVLPSMNPIGADIRSAMTNPRGVYFFDGDVKIASNSDLAGTIVVDGDIFLSGNITVGSPTLPMVLIATGDVVKETGRSTVNGVVYTGGSMTGRGRATINGALIARSWVDMSGNLTITYVAGLGSIGGTWTEKQDDPTSGPTVYRLDEFIEAAETKRMWQEVTNLD